MPATKAWYAGSVTLRLGWVTTIVTSSVGVLFPPASNTAYALADSVWAWFGLPFGSSALMPPIARLNTNRPIVAMNQPANDRPAMARAPHRDPDGGGLAGQVGRCVVGHWKPLRTTDCHVRASTVVNAPLTAQQPWSVSGGTESVRLMVSVSPPARGRVDA